MDVRDVGAACPRPHREGGCGGLRPQTCPLPGSLLRWPVIGGRRLSWQGGEGLWEVLANAVEGGGPRPLLWGQAGQSRRRGPDPPFTGAKAEREVSAEAPRLLAAKQGPLQVSPKSLTPLASSRPQPGCWH